MRTYHIPIFVPHRGCPHDCVFCNQKQITGQTEEVTGVDVCRIIEENLNTMEGDSYIEVAFFGGSFTGIELDKQTELLSAAYPYLQQGRINGIRCSTRADYINDEILTNLERFGISAIELGVQSTDDGVLALSHRGHSFEDVKNAASAIKSRGIELGLQMMLGLPGDTREKMIKTCEDLISLSPESVRIYPTLVVPKTALWNMHESGEYAPLTLEETVDILSEIIPKFERAGIKIIRVGLQTTDNINENTVKGPYHPAIRELANGRIIRNIIEMHLTSGNPEICVNKKHISEAVGHRSCNRKYFKEKYSLSIDIKEDNTLGDNDIKINGKILAIF